MLHSHNRILFGRILWNELLIYAIIWMRLEAIMLSEKSPVIKDYI